MHAERVTDLLQSNAHVADVMRVESGAEFQSALTTWEPDVVVAGSVTGLTQREALQLSRQHHPEVPFVMVGETLDREVVDSLRAGAADFIAMDELSRLPAAMEAALQQRAPLRRLSRRQREVFRLLASGVTMRDIASQLGLSRKTVETHRAQVMARLGARHVPELVRLAIRLGIVSAEDPSQS